MLNVCSFGFKAKLALFTQNITKINIKKLRSSKITMSRMPCLFVNHGGGPMPLLGMDDVSKNDLESISAHIPIRPSAILVVSAHWEASPVRVTGSEHPPLLFDYYGFPDEAYELKYPVKGDPILARKIKDLLQSKAGLDCQLDNKRGYDHGVFVPLLLAFPKGDIPVLEMSLHPSLDPALHIKIGQALESLRDEGVLILGSGMTFHNMRAFRAGSRSSAGEKFDQELQSAVTHPDIKERESKMSNWEALTEARFSHPREEHLMPLHVCVGAAGNDLGKVMHNSSILGAKVTSFSFS